MEVDCVACWRRVRDRHPMSRNLSRGGDEEEKGTGEGRQAKSGAQAQERSRVTKRILCCCSSVWAQLELLYSHPRLSPSFLPNLLL